MEEKIKITCKKSKPLIDHVAQNGPMIVFAVIKLAQHILRGKWFWLGRWLAEIIKEEVWTDT